jgi:hypothetical protein
MASSAARYLEAVTDSLPWDDLSEERLPLLTGESDPCRETLLRVRRTDIEFSSPTRESVAVAVTVRNEGEARSEPTAVLMSAAPLGAFVAWQRIAVVPVPSLLPGQRTILRTTALRRRPKRLGRPDRVPPRRLLIALGSEDEPARRSDPRGADLLRLLFRGPLAPDRTAPILPADLMELLGQGSVHWAGNLNIFLGGQAVERHMAQALRVYPGLVNMAMFVVGARGHDEYSFHLAGNGASWQSALFDMTDRTSFALDVRKDEPLEQQRWIPVDSMRVLALVIRPPEDCPAGSVEVHVNQRSSGTSAVVEFSLDPRAAGPGCYTL